MKRRSPTPIVECSYGWGQVCHLYQDGLEVGGMFYALSELESVYPTYRCVLGIPSARLELHFKSGRLIIPGIADVPQARKIVEHITSWSATTTVMEVQGKGTLSQRPSDTVLPLVLAPLPLLPGENAHYSIEASLCAELLPSAPRRKRRVKDRGKLVLTNKRFIYLGHKRQMMLEYEKILQVAYLPGALALSIERVPRRQLFEMRRPLECSVYLKRLLQDNRSARIDQQMVPHPSDTQPILTPRTPYVSQSGIGSQQPLHSVRNRAADLLTLKPLATTPINSAELQDTQKRTLEDTHKRSLQDTQKRALEDTQKRSLQDVRR